ARPHPPAHHPLPDDHELCPAALTSTSTTTPVHTSPADQPIQVGTISMTQLPNVPSLIPRSRATCAIGLLVSRTSRTAPSLKSRSNFLRVSPIAISLKAMCPRYEGKPRGRWQPCCAS